MTTCSIKFFLVTICLGGFNILFAQNDITVYLQPELSLSYKVKEGIPISIPFKYATMDIGTMKFN